MQGASDVGLIPMVFPDYQPISDPKNVKFFEDYWNTKLDPNPGLTVVEIMEEIYKNKILDYILWEKIQQCLTQTQIMQEKRWQDWTL